MENKFLLGRKELLCVLINLFTVKMLFTYPRNMVILSGNAAWLQCLFVSLIFLLIYVVSITLYEKIGKINIIEACKKIGGKPLKIIVGLVISIILFSNISITTRAFPESIKIVLLPLTPVKIISLVFLSVSAIGAYIGIYSVSRIHSLFIPIVGILMILFALLLIPYADINNLFPILGTGTQNIFLYGIESISIFGDLIVLFILMPFFENFNMIKKTGRSAVIISGIVSTVIVLLYNLIYSYPASTEFLFPVYNMSRIIRIGDFFQRLEAFFEFIWSISILLYSSIYIFTICYLWKEIFDLKYYKQLIFPVTVIMGSLSFIPSSMVDLLLIGELVSKFSMPISFLIPIIISIFYRIKNKKLSIKKDSL